MAKAFGLDLVRLVHHVTAGEAQDTQVFVADQDYQLVAVFESHRVAGAASSTLMLERCASGTAPGSGVDLLASTFALDSTADTPVQATLTTTRENRIIRAGQQIGFDYTGTVSAYEGTVTMVLAPLRRPTLYQVA